MIADAVLWWFTLQLLGVIALPITLRVFKWLPDGGYSFSKPLAILLVSFALWFSGILNILPNSSASSALLILLLAALSVFVMRRNGKDIVDTLRREWRAVLVSELVFAAMFSFWALAKAYDPGINHTEKPMDFAMLNAVLRSESFPPTDPWLSGHTISYYYFGYLQSAMLTKLTGIPAAISYNLSLASIAALAAQGGFGLVYSLVRAAKRSGEVAGPTWGQAAGAGILTALLMLMLGNLVGVLEFMRTNGWAAQGFWDWVSVKGLDGPLQDGGWHPTETWWWWRASRVLTVPVDGGYQETISEFPFFSFMLGDMHPHVMSLPYVLLALGLALNALLSRELFSLRWALANPGLVLISAVAIGALGFLNSWDLPVYGAIFLAAILVQVLIQHWGYAPKALRAALPLLLLFLLLFFILFIPFYRDLHTQVQGVLPVQKVTTRPQHFFLFWGPLFVLSLGLLLAFAWSAVQRRLPTGREVALYLGVALIPFAVWIPARIGVGLHEDQALTTLWIEVGGKFGRLIPAHFMVALALFTTVRLLWSSGETGRVPVFVSGLMLAAYVLLLGTELFFINDLFHTRMNTVFKFYYQGWVLLAVSSGFGLYYLAARSQAKTRLLRSLASGYWGLVFLLVLGGGLYTVAGVHSKSNGFSGTATLDGLNFVRAFDPGEYEALQELPRLIKGQPVILEAVGDDYSDFARVSGRTGIPTLIGWVGHEHQWRGDTSPFGERPAVVQEVYTTEDVERAASLLRRYSVEYVYVGRLERQKYNGPGLAKFDRFMEKVYDRDGVQVYRVRGAVPG
ncbi:MAG: hypothetical protein HYX97_02360 [Chloroflexi bacterium]|nr:hypothetical protein [Chloroflexota bacterium]